MQVHKEELTFNDWLDLSVSVHVKRLLSFDLNFVAREMVDLYDQSNKSYDISLMLIYYIYQEWFLLPVIVTETYC